MSKILKYILRIYYRLKASKKQKENFSKIDVGDMVWAKMPLKKRELKTIEESHRVRPYLVVGKTKTTLICYQSSSKPSEKLNNYEEYYIRKERYKRKRDSWISLNKSTKVPICNIQDSYIKVNDFDLKGIQKRLQIIENREEGSRKRKVVEKFAIPINLDEGDVIYYNKELYYIYAADNIFVYGIKIYRRNIEKQKSSKITINRKTYYIIFNDTKKKAFNRNQNLKIIDIAYPNEVKELRQIIQNTKRNTNGKEIKNEIKEKNLTKKEAFSNETAHYEVGTVFKVGKSKILYLFKKKNKYYGVDIICYIIAPKIIQIKDIRHREILEIKPKEQSVKYIEALLKNNTKLVKEVRDLYDEFRYAMYG